MGTQATSEIPFSPQRSWVTNSSLRKRSYNCTIPAQLRAPPARRQALRHSLRRPPHMLRPSQLTPRIPSMSYIDIAGGPVQPPHPRIILDRGQSGSMRTWLTNRVLRVRSVGASLSSGACIAVRGPAEGSRVQPFSRRTLRSQGLADRVRLDKMSRLHGSNRDDGADTGSVLSILLGVLR